MKKNLVQLIIVLLAYYSKNSANFNITVKININFSDIVPQLFYHYLVLFYIDF